MAEVIEEHLRKTGLAAYRRGYIVLQGVLAAELASIITEKIRLETKDNLQAMADNLLLSSEFRFVKDE